MKLVSVRLLHIPKRELIITFIQIIENYFVKKKNLIYLLGEFFSSFI